jgi:hypothetical protein
LASSAKAAWRSVIQCQTMISGLPVSFLGPHPVKVIRQKIENRNKPLQTNLLLDIFSPFTFFPYFDRIRIVFYHIPVFNQGRK